MHRVTAAPFTIALRDLLLVPLGLTARVVGVAATPRVGQAVLAPCLTEMTARWPSSPPALAKPAPGTP